MISKENARSKGLDGKTLLHLGCASGNLGIVQTVIEVMDYNEGLKDTDEHSYNPMDYASSNLHVNILLWYLLDGSHANNIALHTLAKLPSLLTSMLMCKKSDDTTLRAVETLMENITLGVEGENKICGELAKHVEGWDNDNMYASKPKTKRYVKNILKAWDKG